MKILLMNLLLKLLEEVILNDDLIFFIVGLFDTFYCWCIITVEIELRLNKRASFFFHLRLSKYQDRHCLYSYWGLSNSIFAYTAM